jgi:hypothetical protein
MGVMDWRPVTERMANMARQDSESRLVYSHLVTGQPVANGQVFRCLSRRQVRVREFCFWCAGLFAKCPRLDANMPEGRA